MIIKDFTLIKSIGKGKFGEVFLSSKKGTNKMYAVKKISKSIVNKQEVKKYFDNTISVVKKKNHSNIIKLFEILESLNNFYLVYELCNGGDLSNCLKKYKERFNKPFNQEIIQYIMKQIIFGLQYLHNNNILHKDLKLDNILIKFENEEDKNNLNILKGQIKIIDIDFESFLKNETNYNLEIPFNMAPEFFQNKKNYNKNDNKADIWCLGIICYQMLTGDFPFNCSTFKELIEKTNKGDYQIPNNLTLSKEVINFINVMLQFNPENRLSIDNLLNHDFLTKKINDFTYIDFQKIKNKSNINLNIYDITKNMFEESNTLSQINYNNNDNNNDIKISIKTIYNDNSYYINIPKLKNLDNNCTQQNEEEID